MQSLYGYEHLFVSVFVIPLYSFIAMWLFIDGKISLFFENAPRGPLNPKPSFSSVVSLMKKTTYLKVKLQLFEAVFVVSFFYTGGGHPTSCCPQDFK